MAQGARWLEKFTDRAKSLTSNNDDSGQNPLRKSPAPYSFFFFRSSFFLSPPAYALRAAARGGGRGGLAGDFERRSLEH